MRTSNFYGGTIQDWSASFDISDAKESGFALLDRGILRIGKTDTSVELTELPWSFDAQVHPSWRLRFLSLKWLCPLIYEHINKAHAEGREKMVSSVLRNWTEWEDTAPTDLKKDHWNGHTVALRTTTLLAASAFIETDWLRQSILKHGEWLASEDNWDGPWNHGLMQAIALLGVAGRLDEPHYRIVALKRIRDALNEMIDHQGCINEQAPGYARFIYYLLKQTDLVLTQNQVDTSDFMLQERKTLLAEFMAHATDPSGHFVQLGDTFRSRPKNVGEPEVEYVNTAGQLGRRPKDTVAIYDRGFIFGRSGWGTIRPYHDESFYSIRFGPQRLIHGHNDHMSVSTYDFGRDILVDSGHNGYLKNEYRRHLRSVEAHNVLVVRNMKHNWSAETALRRNVVGSDSHFFELQDEAFQGLIRTRGILAGPKSPLVVCDRVNGASGEKTFEQLWHLSSDHDLVHMDRGKATFKTLDGELSTHVICYAIDPSFKIGTPTPVFSRGSLKPHQGWRSTIQHENTPAPALSFLSRTSKLFLITCVLSQTTADDIGHSLQFEDGWLILRVHSAQGTWAWRVSPGGYMALRQRPL